MVRWEIYDVYLFLFYLKASDEVFGFRFLVSGFWRRHLKPVNGNHSTAFPDTLGPVTDLPYPLFPIIRFHIYHFRHDISCHIVRINIHAVLGENHVEIFF